MLTFHELMGFMSPKMANQILDDTQTNNKDVYRALVVSMAQVLKARPSSSRANRRNGATRILFNPCPSPVLRNTPAT